MTTKVQVGPFQLVIPSMGNPAYAISGYAREKLDDVDHVILSWWPLQAAAIFVCAGLVMLSLIRLWKSCTT